MNLGKSRFAVDIKRWIPAVAMCCLIWNGTGTVSFAQEIEIAQRGIWLERRYSNSHRCGCSGEEFVALMPANNLAKTISDQPSVHVVLPARESTSRGEFTIDESTDNKTPQHITAIEVDEIGGVVSFRVPPNTVQSGQVYRWSFSISPEDSGYIYYVSSWIKRVESEAVVADDINPEDNLNLSD